MSEIIELTKINFSSVFVAVFVILIGIKAIISLLEWGIDKLGLETKWMRKHREEYDLLIQTAQSLTELKSQHTHDVEESNLHDEDIKNELTSFVNDMKESITETQKELKQFAENRTRDREQSIQIQNELKEST